MYRKLLISVSVLATGLFCAPAFAATYNLGKLNPASFDSVSLPSGVSTGPAGVHFSDDYTFTLTTGGVIFSTATISGPSKLLPVGFNLTLFSGAPTSGVSLLTDVVTTNPSGLAASLDPFTGVPGPYYLELSGNSEAPLAIGGTITTAAIPEPSTWALLGLGFVSLAFAGTRRRKSPRITA